MIVTLAVFCILAPGDSKTASFNCEWVRCRPYGTAIKLGDLPCVKENRIDRNHKIPNMALAERKVLDKSDRMRILSAWKIALLPVFDPLFGLLQSTIIIGVGTCPTGGSDSGWLKT